MDGDLHAPTLEVGSLLAGRYRVGAMLGAGGMATVHRATDEVLGRDVAMKVLAHAGKDPAARRREQTEIEMLAALSHRALVPVHDAAIVRLAGGLSTIIVMELVDGPTLARRRADGVIADAELARLALDVAEALVVVHARGIVHRDVKPSNILLAPSPLAGREFDARLADFGIATLEGGARLTATGAVLGTAAYLSPEQAMGGAVTAATDVYSLGLVLLEAITGSREFPGSMLEALTARMLRDPVIPETMHPRWGALLAAMTAREVDERPSPQQVVEIATGLVADRVPASTVAVAATLPLPAPSMSASARWDEAGASSAAASTVVHAASPAQATEGRRPWRRVLGIAAAAATIAAVVGVAIAMQPSTSAPEPSAPSEVAEVSSPPETSSPSVSPVPDPVQPTEVAPTVAPTLAPPLEPTVEPGNGGGGENGNGNGNGNGGGGNGNGGGGNGNGNGNG